MTVSSIIVQLRFGLMPQRMFPSIISPPTSDEPLQIASSPMMDLGFLNRFSLPHAADIHLQPGLHLSGSGRSKINGRYQSIYLAIKFPPSWIIFLVNSGFCDATIGGCFE
jgi:hypothetical protein